MCPPATNALHGPETLEPTVVVARDDAHAAGARSAANGNVTPGHNAHAVAGFAGGTQAVSGIVAVVTVGNLIVLVGRVCRSVTANAAIVVALGRPAAI